MVQDTLARASRPRPFRAVVLVSAVSLAFAACAPGAGAPDRYRLTGSGSGWEIHGRDDVLADLRPRYPEFFAAVLTKGGTDDPNLRDLRDDLERRPVDRRNYDALNAIAIGYYALNARAQDDPGGETYLQDSFRAAKLVAVPWRAYGLIEDTRLRDSILEFFEDVATGEKARSGRTAVRLARVVQSLRPKESDPARLARIDAIVVRLSARPLH